jgi:hypothetical protein
MRIPAVALCILLLPRIIFSQDHVTAPASEMAIANPTMERQYNFAGGVSLRIGRDSMTDKQTCVAITSDSGGASFLVAGGTVAEISTFSDVDYNSSALLRIDGEQPVRLFIPRQPKALIIPLQKAPAVVRALYTQRRIRLRYFKWPEGLFDDEIKIGDFAAAYDRAVELCGWPKIRAAAVHPAAEEANDDAGQEQKEDPLDWYFSAVARRLATSWTGQWMGESGKITKLLCIVTFTIGKDGSVSSTTLSQSSRNTILDITAQRAAIDSSPLPALPSSYVGESLSVQAVFDAATTSVKVTQKPGP